MVSAIAGTADGASCGYVNGLDTMDQTINLGLENCLAAELVAATMD